VFLAWICYPEFTMQKQMRVILYGNTIILAGIHLSLAANPSLEVQVVDTTQVSGQDLLALQPDVIIFDTHSILPEFHFNLIQQRPELQLIGIDPDMALVLVWSGRQVRAVASADLIEILQETEPIFIRSKGETK
jgi:hypothetical protein